MYVRNNMINLWRKDRLSERLKVGRVDIGLLFQCRVQRMRSRKEEMNIMDQKNWILQDEMVDGMWEVVKEKEEFEMIWVIE